jgi:hypothetical protein
MNKARMKVAPAAKKRGADVHVPSKSSAHRPANEEDRKLELAQVAHELLARG